jgi:hypothetical protein
VIKKELSPDLDSYSISRIGLYTYLSDKSPLAPHLKLEHIPTTTGSSAQTPIIVKTAQKTIYIQNVDEYCSPVDSFTEATVESDADIKQILGHKGEALYLLSNPKRRITKFSQVKDGDKYGIFSAYARLFSDEIRWKQKENMDMEERIGLALKHYMHKNLGTKVTELPTDIFGADGKQVQEWGAVFLADDVLYLCEMKHVMSSDKIPRILKKIETFKEKYQVDYQTTSSARFTSIVGAACGTYFPTLVRGIARQSGLICVYPSGLHYRVDYKRQIEFKIAQLLTLVGRNGAL